MGQGWVSGVGQLAAPQVSVCCREREEERLRSLSA